jgi:O-antigen/teichoic acid export membrane protein
LFELFPDKDYSLGESVVFIISIGTLVSMATGINDAIIYTSDKYIYGTVMLLILFAIAVINNYIFIPLLGMNGAAFATAFSAIFFNAMKYAFIWKKFHLQPFDQKTLLILLIIVACFVFGWLLPNWGHPIFQIVYRSSLVGIAFLALLKLLNIVPELEEEVWKFLNKKKILR